MITKKETLKTKMDERGFLIAQFAFKDGNEREREIMLFR